MFTIDKLVPNRSKVFAHPYTERQDHDDELSIALPYVVPPSYTTNDIEYYIANPPSPTLLVEWGKCHGVTVLIANHLLKGKIAGD